MRARTILTMVIALMLVAAIPAIAVAGDRRDGQVHLLPATPGNVVEGAKVVVNATAGQAHISIKTNGLEDGYAYTVWSFSFSNTNKCEYGDKDLGTLCGPGPGGPGTPPGDDTNPDTGFALQQVAGHIVGNGDKVNFGGSIAVANAAGAEYHLVVSDHGPLDPAKLPEQIKTPDMGVQIGFIIPD